MTARLLLVTTDPEDDPCQFMHPHDSWACGVIRLHHRNLTHPFLAPRWVTADDVHRAIGVTTIECIHDREGDECAGILAALTAPEAT